jgi:predicted transcriptional regulator
MRYSRQITELTQKELSNELKKVQQINQEKSDTSTQLRLALLLSLPTSQFYNKGEAKKILSDVINTSDEHAPVLREYAYTLLVSIEKTEESERINTTLRKKLKKEIDRRQQLEQKLEALKSIEESISQRQNKPAPENPNSEEVAP